MPSHLQSRCTSSCPVDEVEGLPPLPGGWLVRQVDLGWEHVSLAVPADPDRLLEDEYVNHSAADEGLPYWAVPWPAGFRMAAALPELPCPKDATTLELGCGLGIVGIAACKAGRTIVLSDVEPRATQVTRYNLQLNGLKADVIELDWQAPPTDRYDVILACDVLYDAANHKPLLHVFDHMLTESGRVWLGDPGRSPLAAFVVSARQHRFEVDILTEQGDSRSEPCLAEFQIVEIRRPEQRG